MTLTFKEVSDIMKIIDASDCEEIVLELPDVKLVVRRGGAATPGVTAPVAQATPTPQADAPGPSPATVTGASETPAAAVAAEPGTQVRAPMVGSFYRRPAPDQPPFVEVGAKVQAGDPLCLIEVMKLYTTIEAPVSGTIKQIAADDAQLVEFDQLLFVIEAD